MSAQGQPPQVPDPLAARLRDALAAPQDALPDGLVEATMAAVRTTRQDHPLPRIGLLATAAAVLAVAFVGALAIGIPRDTEPANTAVPGTAVASPGTPTADATAPVSGDFPATVLELDVISVSDALAVRDAPAGPGTPVPLAVRGWYAQSFPVPCPAPGPVDALEVNCSDRFTWLTEVREDVVTVTDEGGVNGHPPTGPALNPRFLGGVASPGNLTRGSQGTSRDPDPIAVVLIGHWNDGRAAFCTAAATADCARAFVVDGVAWAQGEPVAPLLLAGTDRTPSLATDDVADRAEAALPGWTVASLAVYAASDLGAVDPRLLSVDVLYPDSLAWLVRLIRGGEEPVTLLVWDRGGAASELPAWPKRGPVVDGLTGEIASLPNLANAPCTETADIGGFLVWDEDGASTSPVRLSALNRGRQDRAVVFTYAPDQLVARHLDGEVSILQPGGHVVVTPGWHRFTACILVTRSRAPTAAVIVEVDGEPLPAYELSCGELDREDCLRRAAEVEAIVAEQRAGRTLVSLAFSGPCGSYDALLDDNTGYAADIFCVPATPSPSPSPPPGSVAATCGSDPVGDCAALVDLVRGSDPVAFARAARIVVVGTCPPYARCAMPLRPSLYVVLVPDAWDGTAATLDVWLAQGDSRSPEIDPGPPGATRLAGSVPEFVVAAAAAARP